MTRCATLALMLVAGAACSWEETETPSNSGRGVPRGEAKDPSPAPAAARAEDDVPLVPAFDPAAEAPTAPEPDEEKEKRDYDAELLQALGSPVDCLAARSADDAPPVIAIDVDAYVMPSGGVGRAYARSGTLGDEELTCVRRRVEAIRLATPIEDAPRHVSTTLRLELKKPGNPGG